MGTLEGKNQWIKMTDASKLALIEIKEKIIF